MVANVLQLRSSPNLLAASSSGLIFGWVAFVMFPRNIYLWDLRTGAPVETIDGTQLSLWNSTSNTLEVDGSSGGGPELGLLFLGDINYIEVGPWHVFPYAIHVLMVFSKGTGQCVLDLFSISSGDGGGGCTIGMAMMRQESVVRREHERGKWEIVNEFIAAHISSCGRHLAAFLCSSRLVIHTNLKRALELANIVGDSRYKLYEDFVNEDGWKLGDYLGAVMQAVLGGLDGGALKCQTRFLCVADS
ncbi:hypothetical protein L208DRAFT_1378080 [Tricholoma matsutake]|nr:hypothetical protein L208DRAFT_1378080 [Tricholoma matsutake 945]